MSVNGHLRFGATVLALTVTFAASKLNGTGVGRPLAFSLSTIPVEIQGWVGVDDPSPAESILRSLAATSFLSRSYRRGGSEMGLWVAYYAHQQAGETMHSPKYCVPGAGWELIAQDALRLRSSQGAVSVNDYILIRPGERMRMLYWYQNRRRVVASEYFGKLALMWDAARYRETSGSIVRVTLPDTVSGRDESIAFASEIIDHVRRCFGE